MDPGTRRYVENLTWVWIHPNNTILTEPSPYARRSHLSLLIFRKDGDGKDVQLRVGASRVHRLGVDWVWLGVNWVWTGCGWA
eukprot:354189-Chlamydomonas_euryale.AAC.1